MIKYVAGWWRGRIKTVEVERETESSVWINGRRNAKLNNYKNYFDTWEEAHSYLMEKAQRKVNEARKSLEQANSELGTVKGMKPPQGETE